MSVKDKTEQAKASVTQAYADAKDNAKAAYGNAREKAVEAYDSARQGARDARRKTGEGIQDNPLLALGGGLALGLIIGALLPRSDRERKALSNVGGDINRRAHSAYDAAKGAGKATLADRGLTTDRGENVLRDIVKGAADAVRQSTDAAIDAAKRK
ncbi:hypothetical protein [Sphingomicrobium nitratireducens]|uniref:hypothetical protein n=1 Tax=Sphingomicrobium nitratireducens TaxID=2964666 RepID=UPI00223EB933|nr:hypothetical protein [Sphingomicrobium nitratireducens]